MTSQWSCNQTNTQIASVLDLDTRPKLMYIYVALNHICTFVRGIRSFLVFWNAKPDPYIKT